MPSMERPMPRSRRLLLHLTRSVLVGAVLALWVALPVLLTPVPAGAQVKAQVPAGIKPPWDKGIQPISSESYWHAVACGKQGGDNPPCVFYDTGLCKNEDFALSLYTPYKMVAYTVWHAVRQGKEPPTPSYPEAERTRVVIGVTPVAGSKNPIETVEIVRGGRTVKPVSKAVDGSRGTFTFDFPAFAPTSGITLQLVGRARTITCAIDRAVLGRLR
jgi:hypothetical protein